AETSDCMGGNHVHIPDFVRGIALERRETTNRTRVITSSAYAEVHRQRDRFLQWLIERIPTGDQQEFHRVWLQLDEAQSDLDSIREEEHYLRGIADGMELCQMLFTQADSDSRADLVTRCHRPSQ